jgi:hypothetical protein
MQDPKQHHLPFLPLSVGILLSILLVIVLLWSQAMKNRAIEITQLSPLQKTEIGRTKEKTLKANNRILRENRLPDGSVKYTLPAVLPLETDEIIVQNGTVISERTLTQTSQHGDLPSLTSLQEQFGEPEAIVASNSRYGEFIDSHIYASRGVMVVANRFTKEIYEIHRFVPVTLEEYKIRYAEYIEKIGEHHHP